MATAPPSNKPGATAWLITIAIFIAFFFGIKAMAHSVFHSSPSQPATTYTAAISSTEVIDPAEVNVIVNVTNSGSNGGTPSCTINVTSPGGAYTGFDIFELKPIAAGASMTFRGNITVTNQGAAYVSASDSTVECS